jgi:hypothetical protein
VQLHFKALYTRPWDGAGAQVQDYIHNIRFLVCLTKIQLRMRYKVLRRGMICKWAIGHNKPLVWPIFRYLSIYLEGFSRDSSQDKREFEH